jgi:L-asparaginase/Glu-tRNA(Gln) amidotransferase subunit D
VLEMYGTGNAPSKRTGLLSAITKARANGIIVAALTQCLTGAVMLGKYAVGDALQEGLFFKEKRHIDLNICFSSIFILLKLTEKKKKPKMMNMMKIFCLFLLHCMIPILSTNIYIYYWA